MIPKAKDARRLPDSRLSRALKRLFDGNRSEAQSGDRVNGSGEWRKLFRVGGLRVGMADGGRRTTVWRDGKDICTQHKSPYKLMFRCTHGQYRVLYPRRSTDLLYPSLPRIHSQR